jgi:hypothetical protein
MKKILLIPLLLMVLVAVPVSAQESRLADPGMLPGDTFYFLNTLFEGIGNMFTFGEVNKAERALALAERRLAEAEALTDRGKFELAAETTARYEGKLREARTRATNARQNGKDVDEIEAHIAEATGKHLEVLARVLEGVPEEAKASIERAMETTRRGSETAAGATMGERPDKATEGAGAERDLPPQVPNQENRPESTDLDDEDLGQAREPGTPNRPDVAGGRAE